MKLNGWMRLWVVLSVCWLLLIAYFAYGDFSALLRKIEYEVSEKGFGQTTIVFSASQSDDDIRKYISDELIPLIEKDPQAYRGKVVKTPYDLRVEKELSSTIVQYAMVAFLPVVGSLALGWAFVWVRGGFTRKVDA
jgi:hypothetical protein